MTTIFILICICLIVASFFLVIFLWAVKSGQYDDDYTPSVRILFDDDNIDNKEEQKEEIKTNHTNS